MARPYANKFDSPIQTYLVAKDRVRILANELRYARQMEQEAERELRDAYNISPSRLVWEVDVNSAS